ncbi:Protein BCCIP [Orchesella cincta]|uniref:Protein BCCIP n=1 Tax=Orchesella cincta TaxID=48709 RepID=A0A1D2MEB4_ORCCI|nr:Protein BCCIP [Orchesella cincta]
MSSAPVAAPVELLQMDFEGMEAQDFDVPSMSTLLNQLVKESGVDPGQLAKVLVSQNYVGSVLKPCLEDDGDEEEEDQSVFAIASIINLSERQEPVVKDMRDLLRKLVLNPGQKVEKDRAQFEKVLSETLSPDVKLGLLIKERILNMPVDLLLPSLQSLLSDVEAAVKKKMPYNFTHLVYWSKMYVDKGTAQHYDLEDAWFEENAISHFSYPLKHADTVKVDSDEAAPGAQPIRRIYLFEFSKMTNFLDYLQTI